MVVVQDTHVAWNRYHKPQLIVTAKFNCHMRSHDSHMIVTCSHMIPCCKIAAIHNVHDFVKGA